VPKVKGGSAYNGNIHPPVRTAHSAHIKETYENMALLLKAVSYSKYDSKICEDLKVMWLLVGAQCGYTKLFAICFLNGTAEQQTNITKLRP
jgi:hypothetical protein